ncbi:MAG: hypothetical protein WCG85_20460 [Polyangia bacterium]
MMPLNVLGPFKILASAVVITQLAACSTTYVSSLWRDPTYQVRPRKIMIIGIAKNPANKRTLEDDFAKQLKLKGTDAVLSYAILPDDKDGNKEAIAAEMKAQGADAVLITRIADRKTVYTNLLEVYAPPQSYLTWQNYYEYGYGNITSPSYVEKTQYAVMETNMYDAGNDKLIWSVSSETQITGTDQKFIKSYVNVIVKSMAKQKLLMRE